MTTRCRRSWEVEAARDGRLTGGARESYEAHLLACRSCAENAEVLDALARGLREIGAPEVDDMAMRRLRNRLLEGVDAERAGRPSSRGNRASRTPLGRWATGFAVALAAVVSIVGIVTFASWRVSPQEDQSSRVPAETTIDVMPTEGARFRRVVEDDVDRFELAEGTLRLRVRRSPTGHRIVVKMPDGEIEDIGTAFEVAVLQGRTERVGVEEGRVVLRLASAAPVTIDAGGAWHRAVLPASTEVVAGADASVRATPKARAHASVTTPKVRMTADASASAEDKAYLNVLRLLRDGREPEARAAAEAYLRDFPAGFRLDEMRGVAGAP